MKDITPFVSIITLNFNQLGVTADFVRSCNNLTYRNFELIVVDNNSDVDPTNDLLSISPNAIIYRLSENVGFTGGNNYGMARAEGDYIFIVNNDTEVTTNLLEMLLDPFKMNSEIGVVCPKIKYYSNPELIQYAGYTKINPLTGRNEAIGNKQIDDGKFDTGGFTYYAHGAAMMVKKEVIEKVGMFADDFFIYYEELDWSARITKAGYKIYYEPRGEIFHKESVTMGKESARKAYFHTRNRIWFMKRNHSSIEFLVFSLYLVLLVIPKSIMKYALKGQWEHLRSFSRGVVWNLKN